MLSERNDKQAVQSILGKQEAITREMRLRNWGNCMRDTGFRLGFVGNCEMLERHLLGEQAGKTMDFIDAQRIEDAIVGIDQGGRKGILRLAHVWAFCLRLEYIEDHEKRETAQSQKAKDVSRKFQRPCAVRTYQHHLQNGRAAVFAMVPEIYDYSF